MIGEQRSSRNTEVQQKRNYRMVDTCVLGPTYHFGSPVIPATMFVRFLLLSF